jgi:hypothetical protein
LKSGQVQHGSRTQDFAGERILTPASCGGTPEDYVTSNPDTHNSSYREILIEHLFVGEVMRLLWLRGITRFEVLKPQVDDSGYDLVLEANGIVRHVQLKSSFRDASTGQVKASLQLRNKPSACIVWIHFDPATLELGPFLWFGGKPGEPILDISGLKVAKHTRANASGVKQERPNQRMIRRSLFERIDSLDELVTILFGKFESTYATP